MFVILLISEYVHRTSGIGCHSSLLHSMLKEVQPCASCLGDLDQELEPGHKDLAFIINLKESKKRHLIGGTHTMLWST